MNNNLNKRLNQIENENKIWLIYIIIIAFSYYANYLEKNYFITNNNNYKETYQKINTLIFTTLIIVYAYFEKDAIESYKNKNATLILIASTAILISGFIFLYIIITDNDLETEIAFN